MNHHLTRLFLALAILLAAAGAIAADDPNLIFSISGEHKALADLGVKFTEPGNSAEGYLPYLNGTAPAMKAQWFQALNLQNAIDPKDDAAKKAQAAALAAAGPDLDALLAASRKQDYIMWGTLIKPDPKKTPFTMKTLNFIDLTRLAYLLVGDAKIRAAKGDATAEERLLAAVRIGHHCTEDVESFSLVWGSLIKSKAAEELSALYAAQGKKDLADKWKQYSESMLQRRKAAIDAMHAVPNWSEAQYKAFILNPDMPTSLRLDALISARYCTRSKEDALKCRVTGPPAWVKELREDVKFADPQAATILPLLDVAMTSKELSMMDFNVPPK
jgi:hypothetical protein